MLASADKSAEGQRLMSEIFQAATSETACHAAVDKLHKPQLQAVLAYYQYKGKGQDAMSKLNKGGMAEKLKPLVSKHWNAKQLRAAAGGDDGGAPEEGDD